MDHTNWDTFIRTIQFNNTAWTAIDLSGSSIKMTVKYDSEDVDYIAQVSAVLSLPTTLWTATITIPGTSLQLDNGKYYYDIQWTDSVGTITTILKGFLTISFDVTK